MKRGGGLDAVLLIVWCLILAGQGLDRFDIPGGPDPGLPGGSSPEGHGFAPSPRNQPLHPKFTPVATVVPPIGSAPVGPVSLPGTPNLPGAFGQTSGAFAPPPPTGLSVGPPPVLLIPQTPLGQGGGAFAPPTPNLSLVPLAGNAPQIQTGAGIPYFVPFAQGPTSIINQFIQPPLVPFGQVGVPVQSYLPGFFTGNVNPFNRSCNYYYFAGCGPSGGAVTDFNFSTR